MRCNKIALKVLKSLSKSKQMATHNHNAKQYLLTREDIERKALISVQYSFSGSAREILCANTRGMIPNSEAELGLVANQFFSHWREIFNRP